MPVFRDDGNSRDADAERRDPDRQATSAAASSGRGGDPNHFVFSQDVVRNYDMKVDPEAWQRINESAYLEEYIEGTLEFEGQTIEHVGIRFKGFRGSLYNCFDFDDQGVATRRTCSRLPIKLGFDEYDDEARFYGLKKLNFHVMRNDSTFMHERVSYFLFRAFGVPAPRAVHATLSVNGEPLGLFALVEEIDGRFTRFALEDGGDGNIYKERWPTLSEDADYFASGLESNRDQPDVSEMQAFAQALSTATDDTIESVLREHTNFEALMHYLAVDRAINHWDGPLAFRCQASSAVPPLPPEVREAQTPALGWETCQNKNFYWYEDTRSGELQLVPWDLDVTWGSYSQFPDWDTPPTQCRIQQSGRPPRCDKLVNWFATVLHPHYLEASRQLLATGPLRVELISKLVAGWYAQLLPYAEARALARGATLFASELQSRVNAFAEEVVDP